MNNNPRALLLVLFALLTSACASTPPVATATTAPRGPRIEVPGEVASDGWYGAMVEGADRLVSVVGVPAGPEYPGFGVLGLASEGRAWKDCEDIVVRVAVPRRPPGVVEPTGKIYGVDGPSEFVLLLFDTPALETLSGADSAAISVCGETVLIRGDVAERLRHFAGMMALGARREHGA